MSFGGISLLAIGATQTGDLTWGSIRVMGERATGLGGPRSSTLPLSVQRSNRPMSVPDFRSSSQAIMSSAPAGRPLLPECATVTTHLETNPTQPPWIAVRPRLMSVASDRGAPLDRAKDRRALSAWRSARPAWLAACDLVGDLSRAAMRSGSMRSGCAVAPASRRRPGTVGRHRADPFGCG